MRFLIPVKLLILFLCLPFSLFAQMNHSQDVFQDLPEHLVYQVKQLDQFIARFNNNENAQGIRINVQNTSQPDREKILASLFNLDLLEETSFKNKALKFIREVTGSNIRNLSFYDKNYYATIDCQVLYKNKKEVLSLTMVLEGDAQKGARWAIIGANAGFLKTKTTKTGSGIIPPTNHEVDFIQLKEAFNGKNDISNYISKRHQPNQLDILCYVLKTDELKMLSTSTPTYHFLQIPGWVFTVDFFNRNNQNSGWLISDLMEVEQAGLAKYKIENLFILP